MARTANPDVVGLQELKAPQEKFPEAAIREPGYAPPGTDQGGPMQEAQLARRKRQSVAPCCRSLWLWTSDEEFVWFIPHRTGDILDALLADVFKRVCELVADVVVHGSRNTDPTRLCQSFQARRDIDPIAENVVTLGDYVSEIDADANLIRCQG